MPSHRSKPIAIRLAGSIVLAALLLSACNLTSQSAPTPTQEPSIPLTLPTQPAIGTAEPEATLAATEMVLSPTPTEIPKAVALYSGFIVLKGERLSGYDFDGNFNGFQAEATGMQYISPYTASVFRDGIGVTSNDGSVVNILTAAGAAPVDFIQSTVPVSVAISADGQQIAWAFETWQAGGDAPSSEVWVANMDGSRQTKIAEITAEENKEGWLVFHPVGWTPDGKLLIATQPTGVGGYILYGEWNGMRLYDPSTGSTTLLVPDSERLFLALNSISNDRTKAAISADGIRIRNLSNAVEVQIPALADQNTCGSARFSNTDQWIAYGCGRNDPENEAGQIMLAAADGSTQPLTLYSQTGSAPHVLGWVDENTILFSTVDMNTGSSSVWRVDVDGTHIIKLVDGAFAGLIPNL